MFYINKLKNIFKSYKKRDKNFYRILAITFLCGILSITAAYAWFYSTLDVKVEFFKLKVSNKTGLFISLDGTNFSSDIEITKESIITDLIKNYPNNTNQWAISGLFPVSSNGISSANNSKFDIFLGSGEGVAIEDAKLEAEYERCIYSCENNCNTSIDETPDEIACFNECVYSCEDEKSFFGTDILLNTNLVSETTPNQSNVYLAFDFFLKNVSGSPKSDNLYLDEGTKIVYNSEKYNDDDGVINSLRIGIVKIGSVPLKSSVSTIQNIQCNNKCEMVIYEPNAKRHSEASIHRATKRNINISDGVYFPTYAVIKESDGLELANGQEGSGIPLDFEHFSKQKTITEEDFSKPIFEIPNSIIKMRAYVWIEGQDIDSLETNSNGGSVNLIINFIKDFAGYE